VIPLSSGVPADVLKLLDDLAQIFDFNLLLIALPFQRLIVGSHIALQFADTHFQLRNHLQVFFSLSDEFR
jgi:hypothetical protein